MRVLLVSSKEKGLAATAAGANTVNNKMNYCNILAGDGKGGKKGK